MLYLTGSFSLIFQFGYCPIAALSLCYACQNVGILQPVIVKIVLQVWVKISELTAVENIIGADLVTLLMLFVLNRWDKAKVQMGLSAFVIVYDGLNDIFTAIPIFQKFVGCLEERALPFNG